MENPKLKKLSEEWLPEAAIEDIQEKLGTGEITSRELVLMYLHRIASYDRHGPSLNSVLEINPDALQIAEALDSERRQKGSRGALHGVPVLIKDNIATYDKMHTSAGSLVLADSYAREDSFVAKQLRKAGAVILGKTNMTEWANYMTVGMKNGYSSRGGQVINPYGSDFDTGGSSSGSGASIAAGLAAAAVGTETSGSIISPASQHSLIGVKPTVGLISRTGIIPISHTQDTAGPMTKTVKDAAILLSTLAEADKEDPITETNTEFSGVDFTEFLDGNGLNGVKVAVARETYFEYLTDEKKEILDRALSVLETQGATLIDNVKIPTTKAKWTYDVLTYEFKAGLNAYLERFAGNTEIRSLADVISFNFANKKAMLKYGQSLLLAAENTSGTLTEPDYIYALERDQYLSKENGIDAALANNEADVLVFPNNYGASIPAKAGYPSVTVPAGYTEEGEPVGLTFTGKAYSEAQLLKYAYAFEQATKHRRAPVL
ncbi:amidase family protein [Evansella sp. LMS18]|jgi:amidase|uniref:amidase family protein n=1 Tax=Evansella sp. LMS18 TaxID=2924033 RepID=UPI0020D13642|nr:amidase family protein [Evansella sp. LMS18]UTR08810.1 amidase family protein [Evansella sp. LMS18]